MRLPLAEAGEHLLTEMKARYEVDVSGMVAGIRARLESRLQLTPLSVDSDLARGHGRGGLGAVNTSAFETERLRKVVVSEVRLWPIVEGFALTLIPRPGVKAPCFGADFMLLPARLAANADVYGTRAETSGILAPLGESFARLGGHRGPIWTAAIASNEGLHARVSPRLVGEACAAVGSALGAYLDALEHAEPADAREPADSREPAAEPRDSHAAFFAAFHTHGPRRGPLRWLFGAAWAERYSRLVFE